MTIEASGLAAAQSRVAQIQSLFGPKAAPATATATSATATNGSFGDAMTRARSQSATAQPSADAATSHAQNAPTAAGRSSAGAAATRAESAPATSSGGLKDADAVLATAKKYLGIPYKWGGTNPKVGLDCSGFVQLVFKQHGISLPRVSRDQARQGSKVESLAQAKPGDLVAFNSPVSHIGIYVGDGKMIHAPRTGDVVKISNVHKNITAIRRVLPEEAPGATAQPASTTPAATSPLPAPGVDTAKLATTLRNAAMSTAVNGADTATWQEAVAAAVSQSLVGSDVENPQAAVQAAIAGLGSSAAEVVAAASMGPNATSAVTRRAGGLAPDAVGTTALNQAPSRFRELFEAAERKYGVPATLLAAVAKQESNFKPNAVSRAGAQGLMQIMPGTARGLGVTNAFDPAQAVDGAAKLLRSHLRTFGSTELALAAYNAGPGAVRKYDGIPPFRETQNYVRKIMAGLQGMAA